MYQQLKTDIRRIGIRTSVGKKSTGAVDIVSGMFTFFIVLMVLLFTLKVSQVMIAGAYVEDALAASNLASALIDIEEYGKTQEIIIADPQKAFAVYSETLAANLQLDEERKVFQQGLLTDTVSVLEYMVFNVKGNQVEVYALQENEEIKLIETGILGQAYTPDGILVETATVYSRIGFFVEGLMQQNIYAEKEQSVDIKRDGNEQE